MYLGTVYTTTSTSTTNATSADLDIHNYSALQVDVNLNTLTGGSSPNIGLLLNRKDAFGNYHTFYTSATLTNTTSNSSLSLSVGRGYASGANGASGVAIGQIAQIQVVVAGTPATISYTISAYGE